MSRRARALLALALPMLVLASDGWQALLADVLGVSLFAVGVAVGADGAGSTAGFVVGYLGLAGYVAASPLIHLVHHNR